MRYSPSTTYPRLKNSARFKVTACIVLSFFFITLLGYPSPLLADNDFSFDLNEFEKKPFEWGGNIELKWEHMDINRGSVFSKLNLSDRTLADLDRIQSNLHINGQYNKDNIGFNCLLKAKAQRDDLGWTDMVDLFEAYGTLTPLPTFTATVGKKSYKWGKGYAWNPVGFLNWPKDPNNPEETLEGYITTEVDLVKSFTGPLQTAALTTVILPVWDDVNDEYGEVGYINLAAKLYLLYRDTDIDLIYFNGDSRPDRYGIDFSRNITTNFEIHGELAYIPEYKKSVMEQDGSITSDEEHATSYLLGLRYLSENDITSIIEYYHNGSGYTEEEMETFYQYIDDNTELSNSSDIDQFLKKAKEQSVKNYGKPQPGKNYIYVKLFIKEPFDILYSTPALTTLINLDDRSYSISPELIYTGFTNWELRLRLSILNGGDLTEFDEKANTNKFEFRLRYFF